MKAPLLLSGHLPPSGISSQRRIGPPERPPARSQAALAAYRGMRFVAEHPPDAARAEPAAPGARTARVGDQRIFFDAEWKAHLEDLDRCVHHVADGAGDGVDAVLHRPCSEPALQRLVADIPLAIARVDAAYGCHRRGALRCRHHIFGADLE